MLFFSCNRQAAPAETRAFGRRLFVSEYHCKHAARQFAISGVVKFNDEETYATGEQVQAKVWIPEEFGGVD